MTQFILVRHGHVPGISPERFRGRTELELTDHGRLQADLTARSIARRWGPVRVYTSPMGRCIETARTIATACGAIPLEVLQEINDLDYGTWQGKTHDEIRLASPDQYRLWRRSPELVRFPNGESLQELAARTAEAVRCALKRHPDDTIVMVGHETSNRVLLLQALALPLSAFWTLVQDPCAISELVVGQEHRVVVRINETSHLAELPMEAAAE